MTTRVRVLGGLVVALLAVGLLAIALRDGGSGGRAGVDAAGTSTTTRRGSTTTTEAPGTTAASTTSTAVPTTSAPGTTNGGGSPATPPTTPPPPPTAPPVTGGLAAARIMTTAVVSLDYPIAMAVRPTDGGIWIATKGGGVCRLQGSSCVAMQTVASVSSGGEQGLLGITFNGSGDRFYASYTNTAGDSRLDEFAVGGGGAPNLATRRQVFAEDQPEANHNGGNIVWGPDGRLYLGLGDGGGGGDRHGTGDGNGQDPNTDLGKILRIDPTTSPPLVERWISGVRNPWRFTFDRATRDLWVADVGQNAWEEITYLPAGAQQGRNLGWRCFEGTHRFSDCDPAGGHTGPIFEYSHAEGCSITGGYVYRGARIPDLVGAYLFADYCDGAVRGLTQAGGRVTLARHLGVNVGSVVSFGQDAAGELYVLTPSEVFRIDPA
ncbi:MAG: PQQ-dependent sugar dehydrogenase [Acidimicrobiales bacterium]